MSLRGAALFGALATALAAGLAGPSLTAHAAAGPAAAAPGDAQPRIGPQPLTAASPHIEGDGTQAETIQRLRDQASGLRSAGGLPGPRPPVGAPPKASQRGPASPLPAGAARDAAWLLGLLALHGIGMPADGAQARQWFEAAQRGGHPLAAAGLAWCAIDGCGSVPDPAAARPWIAQLRGADPALALYLDWWVASQLAPLELAARPESRAPGTAGAQQALLARAARAGSAGALNELALENLAQGRSRMAQEQFRQAARRSPAAAANLLRLTAWPLDEVTRPPSHVIARNSGPGTPSARPTVQTAAGNAVTAPSHQDAEALFLQAQRFHRGEGVPSNYAEAIRLYQLAASKGSAPAQRMLELIYSRPSPGGGVDIGWMQQLAHFKVTQPGALLPALPAPGPQPWMRDATPLYELLPPQWRPATAH
jgi:uncharacterized protein